MVLDRESARRVPIQPLLLCGAFADRSAAAALLAMVAIARRRSGLRAARRRRFNSTAAAGGSVKQLLRHQIDRMLPRALATA